MALQDPRSHGRKIRALRDKVRRLMPLSGQPERFHEDKDEVCRELAQLADLFDPPDRCARPSTTWRPG